MSPKLYLNELAVVNLDFKVCYFFTVIHALHNFILYHVTLILYPFSYVLNGLRQHTRGIFQDVEKSKSVLTESKRKFE